MNKITFQKQWVIKASVREVFSIVTDFEKFPEYFPKVAGKIEIKKREGNNLEIEATAKSFGKEFPVKMKTEILPERGFISDNESPVFGTSGHEEFLLSAHEEGTLVDYKYEVTIHKKKNFFPYPWDRGREVKVCTHLPLLFDIVQICFVIPEALPLTEARPLLLKNSRTHCLVEKH